MAADAIEVNGAIIIASSNWEFEGSHDYNDCRNGQLKVRIRTVCTILYLHSAFSCQWSIDRSLIFGATRLQISK